LLLFNSHTIIVAAILDERKWFPYWEFGMLVNEDNRNLVLLYHDRVNVRSLFERMEQALEAPAEAPEA
jgi:hypothetical protein